MSNFVRASSIHPSTSVLGRFPVIGCLGVVGDGVCVPLPGESLFSGGAEVLSVGGAGDALDAPPTAPFPPFADAPPTAPFPPFAAGAAAAAGAAGAAAARARAITLHSAFLFRSLFKISGLGFSSVVVMSASPSDGGSSTRARLRPADGDVPTARAATSAFAAFNARTSAASALFSDASA